MDIKLDFVPPSLINFISRQLIGSGFRLYQKVICFLYDIYKHSARDTDTDTNYTCIYVLIKNFKKYYFLTL